MIQKTGQSKRVLILFLFLSLLFSFRASAAVKADNAEKEPETGDARIHEAYERQKRKMEQNFYDAVSRANEENAKFKGMGAGERTYAALYRAVTGFKERGAWAVTGVLGILGILFFFLGHVTKDVHRKWTGLLMIGFIALMWFVLLFVIGRWM